MYVVGADRGAFGSEAINLLAVAAAVASLKDSAYVAHVSGRVSL